MSLRDFIQNLTGPFMPYDGQTGPISLAARTVKDEGNALLENILTWAKTGADAMASTATAELPIEKVYRDVDVLNVDFMPLASLTGDPTNNAVLTLTARDSNGANQVTVATLTTTASWTAFKPVALTLSGTAANLILAAGGGFTFAITKGGSGVVVPAGTLHIRTRFR